ncbi:MAG: hypothetical protein J6K96_11920 [Treponema sp.]|nr:hypothetical protein [Treponema sp.]
MKRIFLSAAFAAVCALAAASPGEDEELPADVFYKSGTTGFGRRELVRKPAEELRLAPDTPFAAECIAPWEKSETPSFTSETVWHIGKDEDAPSVQDISQILRSISRLKGIQYYSNSRRRWRTLYCSAFLIRSESDRTPVADMTSGSADGKQLFCRLEDSSFGKCTYRLDYRQNESEVLVRLTNISPVTYRIFTAIRPENLQISIVVSDRGSYYSVYMLLRAEYSTPSSLQRRISASLNSRIEALYVWFLKELNGRAESGRTE